MAGQEWADAHQVLMLQLAPAWACKGPQGWAAIAAAAGELRGHDKEVEGCHGPGTYAKGAGLLNAHAAAQVSREAPVARAADECHMKADGSCYIACIL